MNVRFGRSLLRWSGLTGARYFASYRRFRRFTMIPRSVYISNLRIAEIVSDIPGCVVECGVWRGGMIAGLVSVLGTDRTYFLFDSFEGLPPAKEIDGPSANQWQRNAHGPSYYDNCTAGVEYSTRAMERSGASHFRLVKGWFQNTLTGFCPPKPIALLRLDADWYDSTIICLEALYDHVAPGGLIVVDDYYTWDGCSRAVHDFLSRRSAPERLQTYHGICFIRKISAHPTNAPYRT